MATHRPQERGQALVETALGTLVFVTILLFGIHFAELGFLALKVEEAANSALFDATAAKMHDTFTKDWSLWRTAVTDATSKQTQRYQDWDGRESQNGQASNISQVVTQGTPIVVACQEARGALPSLAPGTRGLAVLTRVSRWTGRRVRHALQRVHHAHAVQYSQSLSRERALPGSALTYASIPICAAGRPVNGACNTRFGILLDDWGFAGEQEGREMPLRPEGGLPLVTQNKGYYDMVNAMYQANGAGQGGAASALAALVVGFSPINEGQFYMSFRGAESDYSQTLVSHRDTTWKTSPIEVNGRYLRREGNRCWLGQPCTP